MKANVLFETIEHADDDEDGVEDCQTSQQAMENTRQRLARILEGILIYVWLPKLVIDLTCKVWQWKRHWP